MRMTMDVDDDEFDISGLIDEDDDDEPVTHVLVLVFEGRRKYEPFGSLSAAATTAWRILTGQHPAVNAMNVAWIAVADTHDIVWRNEDLSSMSKLANLI